MAALITGLVSCGTYSISMLGSTAVAVGTYLYQGVALTGTFFWSLGSWGCACLTFVFSCCTGCGHRAVGEVLRPIEEWDESEAKRGGTLICCLACGLTCLLIVTLATTLMFGMTYLWYV